MKATSCTLDTTFPQSFTLMSSYFANPGRSKDAADKPTIGIYK